MKDRSGQELRPSDLKMVADRWQYARDLAKLYRELFEDRLAELDETLDYARLQVQTFLGRSTG